MHVLWVAMVASFFPMFWAEARSFERKIHTIAGDAPISWSRPWRNLAPSEKESMSKIIGILQGSPKGRQVLFLAEQKAEQQGESLLEVLRAGQHSSLNTTLVRRFSPSHPERISYHSRSKVAINRHLSVLDAVLDVAHELTHFALKEGFNPYRQDFGLQRFIASTIEGRGGEVDAYLAECQVLWELFPQRNGDAFRRRGHCHKIFDPQTRRFSRAKSIREFYKVGAYYDYLRSRMGPALAELGPIGRESPHLISSVYGTPYPVAAVYEYQSIMERVCRNDRERLKFSSPDSVEWREKKRLLSRRCAGQNSRAALTSKGAIE